MSKFDPVVAVVSGPHGFATAAFSNLSNGIKHWKEYSRLNPNEPVCISFFAGDEEITAGMASYCPKKNDIRYFLSDPKSNLDEVTSKFAENLNLQMLDMKPKVTVVL